MGFIDDENAKQIRDNLPISVVVIGNDTEPFACTWNPDTMRMTWTATGLPHKFLTIQVNDKTEYVVTAGKRWHPNPQGYVFLPEHSTQIKFVGDGAAPVDADNPHAISGFAVDLDGRSITTCTLALRASLDLVNPSWETSEINLGFILPDVTPEALQFIATNIEGAWITYHALDENGVAISESTRRFYCTNEGIDYFSSEIQLTGVDQGGKLNGTQVPRFFSFTYGAGFERLYALFRSFISNAGITVTDIEQAPETTTEGDADLISCVYMEERSYAEYVLFFMRHMVLAQDYNPGATFQMRFFPRYVDAGRPKITWSYPEAKWVINKAECGDIQWRYEPQIKTLDITNDTAVDGDSREAIETKTVKNGHRYAFDMQTPHRSFAITGSATIIKQNCMRVVVRATADGDITLRGIPIEFADMGLNPGTFTFNDYGQDLRVEGYWDFEGAAAVDRNGAQVEFAPHAGDWYKQSDAITQTVTFTWKGDPRMQPLDVFIWDEGETSSVWTIGSITLDHTDGGLLAEITARRGIL